MGSDGARSKDIASQNIALHFVRDEGCTPLHEAVARANEIEARFFAERFPMQRSVRDVDGRLPFHLAADAGLHAMLPIVGPNEDHWTGMSLTSDDISLDSVDLLGCSPLWLAASGGYLDCCRWLLDRRCDPLRRANDGTNAIWQAARGKTGHRAPPLEGERDLPEVLALLLSGLYPPPSFSKGSSPKLDDQFLLIDTADLSGATLFHAAARENAVGVIKWLVDRMELSTLAVTVRARTNNGKNETAIDWGKVHAHVEAVDFLRDLKVCTNDMGTGNPDEEDNDTTWKVADRREYYKDRGMVSTWGKEM